MALKAVVGGLNRVLYRRVLRGEAAELIALVPDLTHWAASYYPAPACDARGAVGEARARGARKRRCEGGRAPGTLAPHPLLGGRRGLRARRSERLAQLRRAEPARTHPRRGDEPDRQRRLRVAARGRDRRAGGGVAGGLLRTLRRQGRRIPGRLRGRSRKGPGDGRTRIRRPERLALRRTRRHLRAVRVPGHRAGVRAHRARGLADRDASTRPGARTSAWTRSRGCSRPGMEETGGRRRRRR